MIYCYASSPLSPHVTEYREIKKVQKVKIHSFMQYKTLGSQSSGYEEFYLMGYNGASSESQPTFWRIMSPPSSGSKKKPSNI
jgi:hypothetical protein